MPATGFPPLKSGLAVDVAIISGGLAGLTAATLLKAAGKTVAVLEAGRIIRGATGHTTAKLTSLLTLIYDHLVRHFGEARARAYGEAQQAAIELVATLVAERGGACDFARTEAYTFAESAEAAGAIAAEATAARRLGLPAAQVEATPLPFPVRTAVRFAGQARFHPRKYLLALSSALPGEGSHVFEHTRAVEVSQGDPCLVATDRGSIAASHFPFDDKLSFASRLQAVRLEGPVPPGMFIDTAESFSLRSQPAADGELALITGESHRVGEGGDTRACYQRLELLARDRLPHLDTDEVPPGEGRVLSGLHGNVALYRDDAGHAHRLSAVCSHMGCIVHWNAAEKSWDCPCHGSRFGIDGRLIHGPAIYPLERK